MRIAVYGAGAVGGHLAARLAAAGANVGVVARGEHGAAIRARGLALLRGDERVDAKLACSDDPAVLGPQDVVVVAVKGTGLPAIAARLPVLLGRDTRVVFAMNGIPWWFGDGFPVALPAATRAMLDPGDALRRAVAPERIVGCAVYSGNAIERPGVVRNTTPARNRLVLGKPDGAPDATLDAFASLARKAGLDAVVTPRIREALWTKMQLIVACSAASTLARTPLDGVVADPALRAVVLAMFDETRRLGRALGFELADDAAERIDFYRDKAIKPSMLQDLEAGKALEVDNGIRAFRDIARAVGVPVPTIDVVDALIGALARRVHDDAPSLPKEHA